MDLQSKANNVISILPDVGKMVMRNRKVALNLLPSALEGFVFESAKGRKHSKVKNGCPVDYAWDYGDIASGNEFDKIYKMGKKKQWDSDDMKWETNVDPLDMEKSLFPARLIPTYGTDLWPKDKKGEAELIHACNAWILSQFLHGEQGALHVSCQTVEVHGDVSAKLYGATQVMDEARHVEVFYRYLNEKLNKVYEIDDNLYTILHYLSSVSDWDLKYLGMQIMVEGLALGAFSTLYKFTKEPLIKEILKGTITDEARHVHYGVIALKDFYKKEVSASKAKDREDWAFEIARLLRNRFLFVEIYEEMFAHKVSRKEWENIIMNSAGMKEFRHSLFNRLIPNIKKIGLLSDRLRPRYEDLGLLRYENEKSADMLSENDLLGAS